MIDLEAVSQQIRACRNCGLGKDDPLPVPPRVFMEGGGDTLLVIGEAPGRTEAKENKPFVGPSGRLAASWLDRLVSARRAALVARMKAEETNPIDRARMMVAEGTPRIVVSNTVQCWPDRTPTQEEIRACHVNRISVSTAVSPTRVLLFGGVAVSAFMGLRIGDVAGRWLRVPLGGGSGGSSTYVDAFATWHPAATLRNTDLQESVREHLDYMGRTWFYPAPSPACVFCGGKDAGVDNWWRIVGMGEGIGGLVTDETSSASINMCDRHHALQLGKGPKKTAAKKTTAKRKKVETVDVQEGLFG